MKLPRTPLLPPDVWKRNRDRMARKARRGLHVTETNPGPDSNRLRYDYILTAAEVTTLVESVMRDTELLIQWEMEKSDHVRAAGKSKGSGEWMPKGVLDEWQRKAAAYDRMGKALAVVATGKVLPLNAQEIRQIMEAR